MQKEGIKSVITPRTLLLFKDKAEIKDWRRKIIENPVYEPILNEVKEEGNRLIKESDPELSFTLFRIFGETGSRLEYEKVYFQRRRRLNTFAIMLLLEPHNDVCREALENTIWSICNEYTWCLPAHLMNGPETKLSTNNCLINQSVQEFTIDLFAAETAFSLSEIMKLLESDLNPQICKRIYEEVNRRIFHPFIKQEPFPWETATHNWAAVCGGAIGAAAMYLVNDDDTLAMILNKVLRTMDFYLDGFREDGICLEGYGYWQYGFGYYVYFADLLKTKSAGVLDLFQTSKVREIAFFEQKSFLFGNQVVNFSDAVPTAEVFLGLSHYLSRVYPDFEVPEKSLGASYTADHCSRWAPAIRNLIWFDEAKEGKEWKPATFFSEDSQWFISRHRSEQGQFSFAAKGGHNDEPHNHNDIGHFILQGNGRVFLKDLGSGLYNNDYFGDRRYSFLCNGSQGHSVPLINGLTQREGGGCRASIKNAAEEGKVEVFEIDIAKAYELEELQTLIRKFTWTKKSLPTLVLEDYYSFKKGPSSIVERLITPILTVLEVEEGIILEGKERLRILFDRNQLIFEAQRLSFMNHFGENEELMALDFQVRNPGKEIWTKFVFEFI
ncbi:heparinase II/III family protein [Mesobacillus foraminis]|uniref:Heparinase II/III-like protein n=1 Tax=Mesobacillus foraminis TaxID=279826 RepID=A0A4R2BL25_9BACI|nr:heparinase II/III family protein [Mesobacillus foraminis]TCN27242.1 heparinase II/III-like protein [Mesobacillus foraminis]